MTPIQVLPDGYTEVAHIMLTERRRLLMLNLLSLLPMIAALGLMIVWGAVVLPPTDESGGVEWWLSVVLVLVIVLPLHELLHGIAIQLFGHRARYGVKLHKGVLYATADNALFRWAEYVFVALAPLVGITLLGLMLLPIVPGGWRIMVVMGVVLNAGGAVGDLWAVWTLLGYSRRALVRDTGEGFIIYEKPSSV